MLDHQTKVVQRSKHAPFLVTHLEVKNQEWEKRQCEKDKRNCGKDQARFGGNARSSVDGVPARCSGWSWVSFLSIGDPDFFFVARSCHVHQFTFHISFIIFIHSSIDLFSLGSLLSHYGPCNDSLENSCFQTFKQSRVYE